MATDPHSVIPSKSIRGLLAKTSLQRLMGYAGWLAVEKILRMIVTLLVGLWVARYLGPARFGLLNFSIAFVALFSFLGELCLQPVLIRELVNRPEDRRTILASGLALRLIGALFMLGIVAGSNLILVDDAAGRILVVVLSTGMIAQAFDVIDFDFQAQMHPRPIVLIRIFGLVIAAAIRVFLILTGAQLVWFAVVVVIEVAVAALLMLLYSRLRGPTLSLARASRQEIRRLVAECWPLAISTLSVMLYMRIDQVMLERLLGDQAVGIFSAAVRVSESWYFVPMAVLAAVAPSVTSAYAQSAERYRAGLMLFMKAMFGISIVAALVFTRWAGPLTNLLYGPAYRGAASVLAIHAWAGVFASLGVASGPWFANARIVSIRMLHTLAVALVSYSLAAFWLNVFSAKTRPLFLLQISSLFTLRLRWR